MTTKELSTLTNVPIREIWPDEAADFTPWLVEHISELGDELGLEIDPDTVQSEVLVGNYRLDVLARDRSDRVVAIENQLDETNHTHLGQLLTYMAGHDASVTVWIAGKFREEHREALDQLNHRTDENSEFYGVVVEVVKIDQSKAAPLFRVVSAPNGWVRQAKAMGQNGPSDRSLLYRDFFQKVVDDLSSKSHAPRSRSLTGRSYQSFSTGRGGFAYGTTFTRKESGRAQVELYIDTTDRERNKACFDHLAERRQQIESEIKGEFDWERLDHARACRISVVRKGSINDAPSDLDEIRNWMVENLLAFTTTFGPKLADLPD